MREIRGLMCRFAVNSTPRRSLSCRHCSALGYAVTALGPRNRLAAIYTLVCMPPIPPRNPPPPRADTAVLLSIAILSHGSLRSRSIRSSARGPSVAHGIVDPSLCRAPEGRGLDKHNMSTEPACVSSVRRVALRRTREQWP